MCGHVAVQVLKPRLVKTAYANWHEVSIRHETCNPLLLLDSAASCILWVLLTQNAKIYLLPIYDLIYALTCQLVAISFYRTSGDFGLVENRMH